MSIFFQKDVKGNGFYYTFGNLFCLLTRNALLKQNHYYLILSAHYNICFLLMKHLCSWKIEKVGDVKGSNFCQKMPESQFAFESQKNVWRWCIFHEHYGEQLVTGPYLDKLLYFLLICIINSKMNLRSLWSCKELWFQC